MITANLVAKIAFICYRITAKNQKTILIKEIYTQKNRSIKNKNHNNFELYFKILISFLNYTLKFAYFCGKFEKI